MAVGAIIGALLALPTGGMSVWAGLSLGMSLGGLAGGILFPGRIPTQYGPRLQDRQVMSSANGSPIPWGYGTFRVGGEVIWAEKIKETKNTEKRSAKGGPQQTTVTYTYSSTMAVGWVEGPADVTKIWGDSKLLYDRTGTGPQSIGTGLTSTTGGKNPQTTAGTTIFAPVFYRGTEDQLPDPTIQAIEGITRTPAFRGLCYAVVNDFPLADFGNRIPNLRAEITIAGDSYPRTLFPGWPTASYSGAGTTIFAPTRLYVDPYSRNAMIFGTEADVVSVVNLGDTATAAAPAWLANTVYNVGTQINDSNGNIQTVTNSTGSKTSGGSAPVWGTAEAAATVDNNVTWRNSGPGPNVPVMVASGNLLTDGVEPNQLRIPFSGDVRSGGTGIDTAGRLWQVGFPDAAGAGRPNLYRYDPSSFRPTAVITPPRGTASFLTPTVLAFAKVNGRNLMYAFQQSNETGGGNMLVYDTDTLALLNGPVYDISNVLIAPASWKPRNDFNQPTLYEHPGLDPATGIIYRVCYDGIPGDTNWYISILDRRGYGGNDSRVLTIPKNMGTYEQGLWCIFDGADGTLIVGTKVLAGNTAWLLKINPVDGTIQASLALTGLITDQPLWSQTPKAYKGVLPVDGQLRLPVVSGGTRQIRVYDGQTLALAKSTAQTNWLPGVTVGAGITDFSYDETSNSFLTVVATEYGGLFQRIWLDRKSTTGQALSTVVSDLITRTGLSASEINVSALAALTVKGYNISRTSDSKAALQPLAQAHFFDLVESDFKLKAVLRGGSPVKIIPEDDLGIASEGSKLQETIGQQHDLPREITVTYNDPALDYQPGKQLKRRASKVVTTKQQILIELPMSLSSNEARNIAEKALSTLWAERNQYGFKLWSAKYLQLDPSDVIQFTYNGLPFQARLVKTSMGQNHVLEVQSLSEDPRNYISVLPGADTVGFTSTKILALGPTTLFLLDTTLLQDPDSPAPGITGYYYAMGSTGSSWPGGVLFESADDENYTQVAFDNDAASYGYVLTATPAPLNSPFSWDMVTTITVKLVAGATLSSTSLLNVLNGANACYLGGEVIQFANATLNADGTYTLSTLLRGRRGTEWAAKTHGIGETFILLTAGTIKRDNNSTDSINARRYYKAVTIGNPMNSAGAQILTSAGLDLKPYAPAQFMGTRSGSGDFSISWVRRTRVGGAWLDGIGTVPLSEATESYDLEIMNAAGTVVRTLTGLVTPSYFYAFANVQTDQGGLPLTIRARVFQNSAVIGRGFPTQNDAIGGTGAVSGGADATSINGVPIAGTPVDGDVLTYLSTGNKWSPEQTTLTRRDVVKTTASLANGAAETGSIAVGCKSFILLRAVTTRECRLQLYATAADRDADTRAINFLPPTGAETGVVCDLVLTSDMDWKASPPLTGANMDAVPADVIYYRITNLGTVGTVPVTITILPLEVPRH